MLAIVEEIPTGLVSKVRQMVFPLVSNKTKPKTETSATSTLRLGDGRGHGQREGEGASADFVSIELAGC